MRRALFLFAVLAQGCAASLTPVTLVNPPAPPPQAAPAGALPPAAEPAAEPPPAQAPAAEAPAAEAAPGPDDHDHEVDDDIDDAPQARKRPAPAIALSDDELRQKIKGDPDGLGSISVGRPSAGLLYGGVQMPTSPQWGLTDPAHAWGTRETVEALTRAIGKVNEKFPNTPRLSFGHISGRHGGYLSPHKSHQAGRDVDLGYYHSDGEHKWFIQGTASNLDLPRTWALLRAVMAEGDVEMIFIDSSIQRLLADYALSVGEEPARVDAIFQVRGKSPSPVVRHVKGHGNHIHVRFYSPVAEEMGQRAARYLPRPQAAPPASARGPAAVASAAAPSTNYVMHRARNGDVLVNLARHYGTTVEAIEQSNNLRGAGLRVGQTYKIPVPGAPKPAAAPTAKPAPTAPHRKTTASARRGG